MTLDVSASVCRPQAIYLCGEEISVKVCFKNKSKQKRNLAWGCVQLTSERVLGAQNSLTSPSTTAISKSSTSVYSSQPVIIFCDIQIGPAEEKVFKCNINLPINGVPPSFRGSIVKYFSRINVAVQQLGAPIQVLRLPVRIMPSVGLDEKVEPQRPYVSNMVSIAEKVRNAVDNITAPRKAIVFSLSTSAGKVTTLSLCKKAFRLGEDIIGHLDFESSDVACLQYSACLETIEMRPEDAVLDEQSLPNDRSKRTFITQHAQSSDVCMFGKENTLRLGIPMHASPSFHTDTVHLKWRIRFEFVITQKSEEVAPVGITLAPREINIETVTWNVNIYVLPCVPRNAGLTDTQHVGFTKTLL